MSHRNITLLILVALSAGWIDAQEVCAQEAAKPQGKKLDLTFIPNDAVAAAVVHPRRVLTSPPAELWPTEIFTAVGKKEMGFDPLQIEQAVGIVGMPQQGGPPAVGIILRFRQPVDATAMASKIVPDGTDDQIEGRKARIAPRDIQPSIAFADDRTVLIANQEVLSWMLTAAPGDGPLHKLLKTADDSSTAAAYLAVEPLRPMLAGMLPMIQPNVPPMFVDLLDLPMTVDTAELTAQLTGEGLYGMVLELKLGAADEPTAANVTKVLKRALHDGRTLLMAQMAQDIQPDQEDRELKEAIMRYLQRLGDHIVSALEPKQEGKHVTIHSDTEAAQIGVMTALLLPAVQSSREAAQHAKSQNNLKQIALALHNYHDAHKNLPANAKYDDNGKPLLSWRVQMLPYIEEQALYEQFHLDEPWDSEHNKKLIEKMPEVYKHPKFNQPGKTLYQAVVGKGAAFEGKDGLRLERFTDGLSKTVMVVEVAPDKAVPWTKPADWEFDPEKEIDMNDFGSLHAGDIFNAAFADGGVRAIARSIDRTVFKMLLTRNDGEPVDLP